MCSTRCDSPASSCVSLAEPVAIQTPSVTDRTVGIASVTTRTPESRTVSSHSARGLVPVGIAVAVARTAGAAPAAVPAAVAAATRTAVTVAPAPPRAAAVADRDELLLRLAGDVGVRREAQADAAPLAVDLDDLDVDLVALVEDVLDRVDALAGRDVGDVQ